MMKQTPALLPFSAKRLEGGDAVAGSRASEGRGGQNKSARSPQFPDGFAAVGAGLIDVGHFRQGLAK